jgi:hypothetical protein
MSGSDVVHLRGAHGRRKLVSTYQKALATQALLPTNRGTRSREGVQLDICVFQGCASGSIGWGARLVKTKPLRTKHTVAPPLSKWRGNPGGVSRTSAYSDQHFDSVGVGHPRAMAFGSPCKASPHLDCTQRTPRTHLEHADSFEVCKFSVCDSRGKNCKMLVQAQAHS